MLKLDLVRYFKMEKVEILSNHAAGDFFSEFFKFLSEG